MSKYPISNEFFPFNHFAPPISEKFLSKVAPYMSPPKKFLKAKGFSILKKSVVSFDGESVGYHIIIPDKISDSASCLFYIHGGGFVLKAAGYHYMNCLRYAKETESIVIFPDYRLAPKHPFPIFYEDCYAVFNEIYKDALEIGIDRERIGIGGDSAGADLAAGLCIMLHERKHLVKLAFQMFPYPFLDARNNSESCKKYTDTPMWNSILSGRIAPMTKVEKSNPSYLWYSPVEYNDFRIFPPTYIETAEFDCLHDDGILFAERLKETGVDVIINETKGTMHGYDIRTHASVSLDSMKKRIDFMKKYFQKKESSIVQ